MKKSKRDVQNWTSQRTRENKTLEKNDTKQAKSISSKTSVFYDIVIDRQINPARLFLDFRSTFAVTKYESILRTEQSHQDISNKSLKLLQKDYMARVGATTKTTSHSCGTLESPIALQK